MRGLFLFSVVILLPVLAHAQWKVTPEVGVTISKEHKMYSAGAGLKVGANVWYSFGGEDKGFGIRSGLFYVQYNYTSFSGSEINYSLPGEAGKSFNAIIPSGIYQMANIPENAKLEGVRSLYSKTREDYLRLPVMAEYGWAFTPSVRFHIAAGP